MTQSDDKRDALGRPRELPPDQSHQVGRNVLAFITALVVTIAMALSYGFIISRLGIKDIALPYDDVREEQKTIKLFLPPLAMLALTLGIFAFLRIRGGERFALLLTPKEWTGFKAVATYLATLTLLATILQSLIKGRLSEFQGTLLTAFSLGIAAIIGYVFYLNWIKTLAKLHEPDERYWNRSIPGGENDKDK